MFGARHRDPLRLPVSSLLACHKTHVEIRRAGQEGMPTKSKGGFDRQM